jgi:hypothetical protein
MNRARASRYILDCRGSKPLIPGFLLADTDTAHAPLHAHCQREKARIPRGEKGVKAG